MSVVLAEEGGHWPIVSLTEVADFVRGVSYPKSDVREEHAPGFVSVLRATNIQDARLVLDSDLVFVAEHNVSPNQLLRPGDIVVATSSGSKHLVGKSGQLHAQWHGSFGAFCAAIRPRSDVHPRYLALYLQTPAYWRQITQKALGVNINNLRRADLESLELPLPPSDVQADIVAELEKQLSRLDEVVANLKRGEANLKRYKAAVLKAAVEGQLVPTEAELAHSEGRISANIGESIQRILDDWQQSSSGRGKYKEPTPGEFEELPALPDGWAWATIGQLAAPEPNSITDGPFGSNLKTEHYRDSGPRVIRLQNIGDGEFVDEEAHISEEHFNRLRKHEVKAGDLVIATLGENPPRACVLPEHVQPAIVKADCIRFRPHPSLNARYLNAALNALPTRQRTKDLLHGVGRPRLSLGEIKSIPLPLPPVEEQRRIAVEIDRLLSVNEKIRADVDRGLAGADRLRRSILEKAFRGVGADQGLPLASHGRDRGDSTSVESNAEALPDTRGENLMRIVKKIGIRKALEANSGWLSTADLLIAAGLPPAASPGEMEQFYLQLREVLRNGAPAIEVQRRDEVDYFRRSSP